MRTELRVLNDAELRVASGNRIQGYAAVFNSLSDDLGGFKETIQPGTFARAIREKQDVRCLFNHNKDFVLGRTLSGTLSLQEDGMGLEFECHVPNTSRGHDLYESIRRGDVSQCSFGFVPVVDEWSAGGTLRTLKDVDLLDVSPCTYPAYSGTGVSARAARRQDEIRTGVYQFVKPPRSTLYQAVDAELETQRNRDWLRLHGLTL